ncbi:hypothetical protein [Mycobacterium sp.]|uniref:hypothetical protein n=1 Tax=Mycobacterium sp. TaxID=1785 RepID=UPI00126EAF2C|nr:hypothetical protein [Mycobacterium sp.]KAA8959071.1 MAG: hypothetical protein F6Q13_14805 [Mycobacterium sp.]
MSEVPEIHNTSTSVASRPAQPFWLYRFAAWVAIVAGIVFITAVIFFAGVFFAHHGGYHGHRCHHHRHHHSMVKPGGHHHGAGGDSGTSAPPGPGQPPRSALPSNAPATP